MSANTGTQSPGDPNWRAQAGDLFSPSDSAIIATVGNAATKGDRFQIALRAFIDMHATTDAHNLYRWRRRAVQLLKRKGAPAVHVTDQQHTELVAAYNAVLLRICETLVDDPTSQLARYFAQDYLAIMDADSIEGKYVTEETRSAMCITAAVA